MMRVFSAKIHSVCLSRTQTPFKIAGLFFQGACFYFCTAFLALLKAQPFRQFDASSKTREDLSKVMKQILDSYFNEFNNETTRLKIWVAKRNQVMLIFYHDLKATGPKIQSMASSKTRKIPDNLTAIPMCSVTREFCVVKSLIRGPP